MAYQPVSSKIGQEHFRRTVENAVPLQELSDFVDAATFGVLSAAAQDGAVRLWGVGGGALATAAAKMRPGDYIVFTRSSRAIAMSRITASLVSPQVSEALWPTSEGEHWDNIFALSDFKRLDVAVDALNAATGDAPGYRVRGFRVLNPDAAERAWAFLNESEPGDPVDGAETDESEYTEDAAPGSFGSLGYETGEPTDLTRDRWLQAQRDLITTTLDYNLQTIAELVESKVVNLSPTFQRRARWDSIRQSRLIESFFMNVPMPPVFLNEDEYGKYSIIDGKQRFTAITSFMSGELVLKGMTVFTEAEGSTFFDLDPALQAVLRTRASLRAIILLRLSDPYIKYHVFQRLNTGGVRLNAQEVRNVAFEGPLNNTLVTLSSSGHFREMLGIDQSRPETSALYREMRDVELVLRYFTFKDEWPAFGGSLGGALNEFMAQHRNAPAKTLTRMELDFTSTLERARLAFGDTAFRRWSTRSERYGSQPLATLFEAQMIAVKDSSPEVLARASADIILGMQELFSNPDFARSIGSATNTPAYLRHRVSTVQSLVNDATHNA